MRRAWVAVGMLAGGVALRRGVRTSIEIWSADAEVRMLLPVGSRADLATVALVDRLLREQA